MLKRGLTFYLDAYRGLPRAVWLLSFVTLVNRAGTMVLFFMTLYLTNELGLSMTFAGSVLGVYGVGALLGTLLGGRLTDLWGCKKVLWLSLLTASFNFMALELLQTPTAILGGMFTLGLFSESHRPAGSTAVAEVCAPDKRVRAYGLYRLAINVGSTIGPALGGLFAAKNYVLLFRIDGLTCMLAAGLVFLLPLGRERSVEIASGPKRDVQANRSPLRDPPFVFFTLISIGIGCIFFQIFSTYPVYLKDHYQLAEEQIGLLLSFNGLLIIVFEMVLLHSIENRSPLNMIAIGTVFTGLGFAILPGYSGMAYAAVGVLLWTTGEMLTSSLTTTYTANRSSDTNRGRYMGLINMAFSTAMIVGPATGTFIYDRFGPNQLWVGIGLGALLLAGALLFVERIDRPLVVRD